MDVKEAVKAAKAYIADVFHDEGISNLGLEEIERDEYSNSWKVTLGFSRPWNTVRNTLTMITGDSAAKRSYKVVLIDDDGRVTSVKQRDIKSD